MSTLPAWLSAGIRRAERERKADNVARPMRALLSQLARGEVHEYDGRPVMRMPEGGDRFAWCEIAPAIEGWCDCWSRISPELSTYFLRALASRLRDGSGVTPRLIDQAREEFDAHIKLIATLPEGQIRSAITTTQLAWEIEKCHP